MLPHDKRSDRRNLHELQKDLRSELMMTENIASCKETLIELRQISKQAGLAEEIREMTPSRHADRYPQ